MMQSTFEDLNCWKACYELKKYLRKKVISKLPKEEKYDLCSQISRASRSTTANIAEGYGRYHYKDNARILLNARGSCFELIDHLIEAVDNKYIDEETFIISKEKVELAIKLINGYIKYLRDRVE